MRYTNPHLLYFTTFLPSCGVHPSVRPSVTLVYCIETSKLLGLFHLLVDPRCHRSSFCSVPSVTPILRRSSYDDDRIHCVPVNPLEFRGNYSSTSNNILAVDGCAVTFCTTGREWVGPQPAQAPPRCTKCNSPLIYVQYTNAPYSCEGH